MQSCKKNLLTQVNAFQALLLYACFLLPYSSLSQSTNYKVRHITSKQGLSQSVVNCMLQDSRGFMWLGTQDGLNRYDGNKIDVYVSDLEDSLSLAGNYVTNIIEDKQQHLWIGSPNNGISVYFPQTNNFKRIVFDKEDKSSIADNSIKNLFYGSDGLVWATTTQGLTSINPQNFNLKNYFLNSDTKLDSMNSEIILAIEKPIENEILVFTSSGISKLNINTGLFTAIPWAESESLRISNAVFDNSQFIYLSTQKNGVKVIDVNTLKVVKNNTEKIIQSLYSAGNPFVVTSAYTDSAGLSYLGTDRKGVLIIDEKKNKFKTINSSQESGSLLSDNVNSVYFDSSGLMWVATDLGVDFLQLGKLKFNTIAKQSFEPGALLSNDIMSILVDGNKLLLGTSSNGLCIIDQTHGNQIPLPKGIMYGSLGGVLGLLKDSNGNYWLGTWGGGLVKLNLQKNSFKQFTSTNSFLNGRNITCLLENKNSIWIGSYEDGLYKIDKTDETFSKFTTNNGLSSNSIFCLSIEKNNKLWIGTNGGGINIFDIKKNTVQLLKNSESNQNSISSNTINCIYFDNKDVVWIATDNGLNKLNLKDSSIVRYYKRDGLPNNYIYSILPDDNGNLWMSTNLGLSKFNPAMENVEGSAFTNYTSEDGLQGDEFNQGAYFKGKDGQLFFGGLNGLSSFYPDQITSSKHVPAVYITSYKRFNREVSLDTSISFKRHITVSYKENSFAFEFTALNFDDPTRNKYSWKMEGLQSNWMPPSNRNVAEYPELSPGEYVFRVKASNSDGVWNNDGASVYITVLPPWYKTTWAYTSFAIIILFGVFGYTQLVARQKRVLEKMVKQRTIQLAEKNRDITSSIEYARKIQDAILPPIEDIHKAFKDCFVFYKPRDIVSGDFYWFYEKGDKKVIAAVDCTGHGVPGAFMSMIGHNLLNQIVIENGITQASEILNHLHKGVLGALKQGQVGVENKDGMDISLCVFDNKKLELQYAGAYRPLYLFTDTDNFQKINGDKFPIGGSHFGLERRFTQHTLTLTKGQMLYMFTDGFADQFGGEYGKKFMLKRFVENLKNYWRLPANEQGELLEASFNEWKGKNEQVDDVLVIGIKT